MSGKENSKLNKLLISESNYSCEYFDENYIKQKNDKTKKLYNLEEKEQEIYDNQQELSKNIFRILSLQNNQFNSKYNNLRRKRDFKQHYYDEYNNKIQNLMNNYDKSYNNSILNFISEFNNNWIFPKNNDNLSNNVFKKKCDIKVKTYEINNKKNIKSKSCSKLLRTYRTSKDYSLINLKKQFSNDNNNKINKYKSQRISKYNSESKMSRIKPKNRSARTSIRNSKIISDKKYNLKSLMKNGEINWNDKIFNKANNNRFLTRENFYPKNLFLEVNKEKEKIIGDNYYNSTKTSFRNYRRDKDLNYSQYDKKFETQYNLYNYSSNNKRIALKQNNKIF